MFACRSTQRFKAALAAACALAAGANAAAAQGADQWNGWDEPRRYQPRPEAEQAEPYDDRYDQRNGDRELRRYRPRPEPRPEARPEAREDDDGDYEYRHYRSRRDQERTYEDRAPEGGSRRPAWRPAEPEAEAKPSKPSGSDGGQRPFIQPAAPPVVAFRAGYAPGSIVIDTGARRLYYVRSNMSAFAYPIGVGREGFAWTGAEKISRVTDWPDWYPPAEMRKRKPELPERMLGGIRNPLGAKALYLGNSLYRIHGTNDPKSIGKAESSGCFRMLNENVLHLASLATIGTQVTVVRSLGRAAVAVAAPATPAPRPRWTERPPDPRWSQRPLPPPRWTEPRWSQRDRPGYWRGRQDWAFPDDTR